MDPNKSPKAKIGSWMQPKSFFAHHKSIGIVLPKTIFDTFKAISMKIHQNHKKIATSARLGNEKLIYASYDHTKHIAG